MTVRGFKDMAIRFMCDGCDKHIFPNDQVKVVKASIIVSGKEIAPHGELHLCGLCARRLEEQANPRNWARAEAAVKEH